MGAFLIAAVALYYSQMTDLDPQPFGASTKFAVISQHLQMNSSDIKLAMKKIILLAIALEKTMKSQSRKVPEAVSNISALAKHENFESFEEIDLDEVEAIAQEQAKKEDEHRQSLLKLRQKLQNFQAVLLAIGTIQWGFGDLIGVKCPC